MGAFPIRGSLIEKLSGANIMGYYIRFIVYNEKDITLDAIEDGLKDIDSKFNLAEWDRECEYAEMRHGDDLYGELEICRLDQDDVDEEIEELMEEVEDEMVGDKDKVIHLLRKAKAMLVIRILWQDRDAETTIHTIAPLWDWLFDNYQGLLQIDGEGYFDKDRQVLQME
jgi:hypothetical protein